ncbi:2-oxoglutarate dehydrogenase E1 component [Strigomonas culicis]|uniref:2-oxoglutarate dehydrogenase, mitochondrial n=1 Tax=Strigomonas culicis TaxID=28005 RepID=S9VV21_9TRYP|nr:2-oxoglutarate dehydrogenase E1 component [Strigomonas culicis]EPY31031.1 2-oxoglutarate dehydrogenase E1 component [Strigomonas culicis]|eukprot:EPY20190.1 2-oxoglutarate dehydrogenase E1 component [Strigomonas culicis]
MMRRMLSGAVFAQHGIRAYTDAKTIRKPNPYDQILQSSNQEYVEHLLAKYEEDRALVDPSWIPIFDAMRSRDFDQPIVLTFSRPYDPKSISEKQRLDNMRLAWMIREYEESGHYFADTNPLKGILEPDHSIDSNLLDPLTFGFSPDDLKQVFNVTFGANHEATFVSGGTAMTLEQIIDKMHRMYCGPIGFEFMSSGFFDVRNWFRQEILYSLQPLSIPNKKLIYNDVVKACGLEKFLQIKYATQQRFGLDGGEATIPALNAILMEAASSGMDSAIIGMAHRGRLNTLANVCHMSIHSILNEFEGNVPEHLRDLNGDVKYHIGINHGLKLPDGQHINIEMIPNPSHLEAVNPLVLGKVRARQAMRNDVECTSVLPLLIHGDASFTGQGSCYETMGFCELENFHCGGTVHVVINNQIGFTTSPDQGRATRYCTDLAKVNNAPVMHVNGHNVEACVKAARIAARFRQQFHRDIILDIVCYRRNGHNEQDLPDFTQPQMYDYIRKLPPLVDIYSKQLIEEGVILADERATKEKEWEGNHAPRVRPPQQCPRLREGGACVRPRVGEHVRGARRAQVGEAKARRAQAEADRDRCERPGAAAGRHAHHVHPEGDAGGAPRRAAHVRGAPEGHRERRRRGVVPGGAARLRHALAAGRPHPPHRRGRGAWHLHAAPRRHHGPEDEPQVLPRADPLALAGAHHHLEQLAVGARLLRV